MVDLKYVKKEPGFPLKTLPNLLKEQGKKPQAKESKKLHPNLPEVQGTLLVVQKKQHYAKLLRNLPEVENQLLKPLGVTVEKLVKQVKSPGKKSASKSSH